MTIIPRAETPLPIEENPPSRRFSCRNSLSRGHAAIARLALALCADRRGNILMITGLAIMPLTLTIGFGVDYARAEKLQTKLNAAADAAALVAVDPSMILLSDKTAHDAAVAMFNAQASGLSGLTNVVPYVTVTATANAALGALRKVTVSYTALSTNSFGGILHMPTLPISGSTTANAQQPPNVNFFLAMDVSPSMLLPATASGLTAEASATSAHINSPNGCDFACHEMIPHNDGIYINDSINRQVLLSTGYYGSGSTKSTYYLYKVGTTTLYNSSGVAMNNSSTSTSANTSTTTTNTYSITDSTTGAVQIMLNTNVTQSTTSNGKTTTNTLSNTSTTYDTGYWADGYWLTQNYGLIYSSPSSLILRRDDEIAAAQQLIPYAQGQETTYHVSYQMQMFSFDWTHPGSLTGPLTRLNNMTDVNSMGSVNVASLMPATDYWWQNSQPTNSTNNSDEGTEMGNMLTQMTLAMPPPGNGSAASTPQEILFIVTDGMADENQSGRVHAPLTTADLAKCATIKNKGIKIAILYTQYLPQSLAGDGWSQSNVAPYLNGTDQDLAALKSCASPGAAGVPLVQTVTTDGDFTAALQQLFSTALQSARLVM